MDTYSQGIYVKSLTWASILIIFMIDSSEITVEISPSPHPHKGMLFGEFIS